MEILTVKNLNFKYQNTNSKSLNNITFSINFGEFIVVCGQSGCGKTTLLKMLKKELTPFGEKSGDIIYMGEKIDEIDLKKSASEIGYVQQNPEAQIVTDKVWRELAFSLENLGYPSSVIRRKTGEMASFFGIQDWFRKDTATLSGGQKQLLNLASVMAVSPRLIILDEPTSQLDPISANDFIAALQKLNRELGVTIILAEHRLEEIFPIADRVIVMDSGKIIEYDTPKNVGQSLKNHNMSYAMPSAVRIFHGLNVDDACPLTAKEGREFLSNHFTNEVDTLDIKPYEHNEKIAIEAENVYFRYEKNSKDVLRDFNLKVYVGENFCILGGNGTGKTTALNVMTRLFKPYSGKIFIKGKNIKKYTGNTLYKHNIALLPQNPQTVFIKKTVYEDLKEICKVMEYSKEDIENNIKNISVKLGIDHLLNNHPYDLSGGEQQKAAIAKMLLLKPRILFLDEPTKGIDAFAKKTLISIFEQLKSCGITVITVTHDIEFAALCADRCALFFDGDIISVDTPNLFFSNNSFYTTSANRISRHMYKNTISCDDVIKMCNINSNIYNKEV